MKIITIFVFSLFTYLATFSHIDSIGLLAKKTCQGASFNILSSYYHNYEKKPSHGEKCHSPELLPQLANNNQLSDYYTEYVIE